MLRFAAGDILAEKMLAIEDQGIPLPTSSSLPFLPLNSLLFFPFPSIASIVC